MNLIWCWMKKRSPSSEQNGQLVHWWLLVHSGWMRWQSPLSSSTRHQEKEAPSMSSTSYGIRIHELSSSCCITVVWVCNQEATHHKDAPSYWLWGKVLAPIGTTVCGWLLRCVCIWREDPHQSREVFSLNLPKGKPRGHRVNQHPAWYHGKNLKIHLNYL